MPGQARRGFWSNQGGTGIPERSEDMPGKSLIEVTERHKRGQPLQRILGWP
jgi:hypothetical protein